MVLTVSEIIDGDTIYADHHKIRLSLTNTPEKGELGFQEATLFTAMHCPVGSTILVDQDDLQSVDVYGRILGKVYCEGGVINEMLLSNGHANILTQYCSTSEFSGDSWAQSHGCKEEKSVEKTSWDSKNIVIDDPKEIPKETGENCDKSYPDVCIAPYPPDLNCGDISFKNFRVVGSDPHRFDGNKDGIGCES
jgi:micrococcal nuclease